MGTTMLTTQLFAFGLLFTLGGCTPASPVMTTIPAITTDSLEGNKSLSDAVTTKQQPTTLNLQDGDVFTNSSGALEGYNISATQFPMDSDYTEGLSTTTEPASSTTTSVSSTSAETQSSTSSQASSTTTSVSSTSAETQSSTSSQGNQDNSEQAGSGVKEDSSDNDFKYDYSFLRRLGLVFAGVLFIMGILVMSCGRSCRMPKCRMKKGKSYDLTRV
ncbi:FXYD domain containing ion transport regulator 5 isoform X1 [Lepisosteus oculatus]|uniref:FXYD domain containing ion transport regulator 5 isoform X1 n=1 Tax=Lepisosteus oculatus TaxID=7918 RepID=UPI003710B8D2